MIGVASKTKMSVICNEAHVAVDDAAEVVAVDVDVEGCMQQSCRTMKTSSHIGFFRSLQNIKEIFADFCRENDTKKKRRKSGKNNEVFQCVEKKKWNQDNRNLDGKSDFIKFMHWILFRLDEEGKDSKNISSHFF